MDKRVLRYKSNLLTRGTAVQRVEKTFIAQRSALKNAQLPRRCLWLCVWSCTSVCRMCHLHGAFSSSADRSSERISIKHVINHGWRLRASGLLLAVV